MPFDGKTPHSDLYVSSAHAIYIDGILIPAGNLVNGLTIVADAKPDALSLTYFHIELDTREVLLAEGWPIESLLRNDSPAVDNQGEYIRLYGSPVEPMTPFAPIVSYNGGRQELASHIGTALGPSAMFAGRSIKSATASPIAPAFPAPPNRRSRIENLQPAAQKARLANTTYGCFLVNRKLDILLARDAQERPLAM